MRVLSWTFRHCDPILVYATIAHSAAKCVCLNWYLKRGACGLKARVYVTSKHISTELKLPDGEKVLGRGTCQGRRDIYGFGIAFDGVIFVFPISIISC